MCNFIYNDIIATAFLTSASYFLIRFLKEKSFRYILASTVLLSIGSYFRNVGVLVLIAAAITILLSLKKLGMKKAMAALCILVLLFNVPNWVQDAVLQKTHVVSESINKNSAPVYMWLNMGINPDMIGFWDNWQSYDIYERQGNYNKQESTKLFKAEIKNKLSSTTLGDLVKMYYKKILWTWTEGTYQVERYGIGNEGSFEKGRGMGMIMGGYSYSTFATDLLKGDSKYRSGLLLILYVMNFLMYCFIVFRLIRGIRIKRFDEVFAVLVILGFIGFYILWEIKSRYIYPVYPLLIVLSYMGFKDAYDLVFEGKAFRIHGSARKEIIKPDEK
jgi:4-amino-4-deoxy-L-arabinose transferase-like glycosyltransferase